MPAIPEPNEEKVSLTMPSNKIMQIYNRYYYATDKKGNTIAEKPDTEKTIIHKMAIIKTLLEQAGVKDTSWVGGTELDYNFCDKWFQAMKIDEIKNRGNVFMDILKQEKNKVSIITSNKRNFYYLYNAYVDEVLEAYKERWKTDLRNRVIFNEKLYKQSEDNFIKECQLLFNIIDGKSIDLTESFLIEADLDASTENAVTRIVNFLFFEKSNSRSTDLRIYTDILNFMQNAKAAEIFNTYYAKDKRQKKQSATNDVYDDKMPDEITKLAEQIISEIDNGAVLRKNIVNNAYSWFITNKDTQLQQKVSMYIATYIHENESNNKDDINTIAKQLRNNTLKLRSDTIYDAFKWLLTTKNYRHNMANYMAIYLKEKLSSKSVESLFS